MIRKYIQVKGIVQGVGFRPFVYKIAMENNLIGNVKNTSSGVYINIQGNKNQIDKFIHELRYNYPKLSQIEDIIIEKKELEKYNSFNIIHSDNNENGMTLLSPDIAICNDCLKDIRNKNDGKRYNYAFTNCTNCGPRYSIIQDLPYDRVNTSMKNFVMCESCNNEYKNPLDRRFHAQPTCCIKCGPSLILLDNNENIIHEDELYKVKELLKLGKIVAIKGLGGFHLVCDGRNYDSIQKLRDRKNRKYKPLALMMKDINTIKKYCHVNDKEEEILLGNRKPILLLNKRNDKLPKNISFNNHSIGIMLPYTPLHYLLFDKDLDTLVMTSANLSGMPMIYTNDKALSELKNIADYFLINDRDILTPVDDSVVKVVLEEERVIRNARAYAPLSFKKEVGNIFSLGSHLKNTFSISKNNYIFCSQYLGNMENLESINNYKNSVKNLESIYKIEPDIVAYDNHPNFWHNDYLKNYQCKKVGVYHHHAHIVSCMFENGIDEKVIGLAFDGVGYGEDGCLWGSEFLVADYKEFERVGHLNYMKMPGGDNATKEPWKMGISLMYNLFGEKLEESNHRYIKEKNYKLLTTMINKDINSPLTSSMGRFFDAISSLLGFDRRVTYEGEACVELENMARESEHIKDLYNYKIINKDNQYIIDTNVITSEVLKDIDVNTKKSVIAIKIHNTVVDFSYKICNILREKYNINKVALSGGVFQNDILFVRLYNKLSDNNFEVLTHKKIPCNDSGVSIGQLIIANNRR